MVGLMGCDGASNVEIDDSINILEPSTIAKGMYSGDISGVIFSAGNGSASLGTVRASYIVNDDGLLCNTDGSVIEPGKVVSSDYGTVTIQSILVNGGSIVTGGSVKYTYSNRQLSGPTTEYVTKIDDTTIKVHIEMILATQDGTGFTMKYDGTLSK
jgi:hypothetical protein